jgi:hypothetical protein
MLKSIKDFEASVFHVTQKQYEFYCYVLDDGPDTDEFKQKILDIIESHIQ